MANDDPETTKPDSNGLTLETLKHLIIEQCSSINERIVEKHDETNKRIDEKHENLVRLLANCEKKADEAITTANDNKTEILKLKSQIEVITTSITEKTNRINLLEDTLNDQIDRNLRSTLIIRGLPKKADENTWDDTANVFADYMAQKLNWNNNSRNMLFQDIERIHRGKENENSANHRSKIPAIYVKFHSWKTAQNILKEIIKANKSKMISISAQQMYSKSTQAKMDEANKVRLELKNNEEQRTWATYVKYPGILMVKKSGERKYSPYNP